MPDGGDAHLAVIVDVDNTLYDWVAVWAGAFSSMLRALVHSSGYDDAFWSARVQAVHAHHGATECPSLLADLAAAPSWPSDVDPARVLPTAAAAYRDHWSEHLTPYDGVREALAGIASGGHQVVAYTEADASTAAHRIARLGLSGTIRRVFGRAPLPLASPEWCLVTPTSRPDITLQFVPREENKPHPQGLLRVLSACGVHPSRAIYVGDNLWKDVAMAKAAGATAVWARYGTTRAPADVALLERVAHWRSVDVSAERRASPSTVSPDAVIDHPSRLPAILDRRAASVA
jgi:phosphoglycolate phosphatase-like HAD superfamily hydrolase